MTSAERPELSLVMITRDEADWMESFLRHHAPLVDEIVIVDTGSTDTTLQIASGFTDKIALRPWDDDYSAPRNLSMALATGRWLLWLDPDEMLGESEFLRIREMIRAADPLPGYGMLQRTYTNNRDLFGFQAIERRTPATMDFAGYVDLRQIRLVRADAEIRFQGRIHEMLQHDMDARALPYEFTDIAIDHYKELRSPEAKQRKAELYYELTRQKLAENPEEAHPLWEFSAAAEACGKLDEASDALRRAVELKPSARLYQRNYLLGLLQQKRFKDAEEHCEGVLKVFPNDSLFLGIYGEALMQQGLNADALDIFRLSLKQNPRQFYVHINVSAILLGARRFEESIPFLKAAASLDPSSDLPWVNMGCAQLQLKRMKEARQAFNNALSRRRDRWQTYFWMARLAAAEKKDAESQKHLETARSLGAPADMQL